jgi:hypothetical protein
MPKDEDGRLDAQPVTDGNQDQEIKALKDEIHRGERWMIGLTAAIAAFALGSVAAALLQWRVMSRQLDEMHTTGEDTHTLALAAQQQANAAQHAAMGNLVQATQAIRFAESAQTSASAASASLKVSNDALVEARKQNEAAATAFRLEQRAKVEVQGGRSGKYLGDLREPGSKAHGGVPQPSTVHIDLVFENVGKTAAADAKLCAVIHYVGGIYAGTPPRAFSLARNFDDDCRAMYSALTGNRLDDMAPMTIYGDIGHYPLQRTDVGIIYPGESLPITVSWLGVKGGSTQGPFDVLNALEIGAIKSQAAFLVITARLSYRDVFGESHDTIYCARWQPPSDDLIKLGYGNAEN